MVQLAKEEGHTLDDSAAFVINIGSPADRDDFYKLTIGLSDYVHFSLRKAVSERRLDVLTWLSAQEALYTAGIRPTGKTKYVTDTSPYSEKLEKETTAATSAISDLLGTAQWLKTVDKEIGEKMERALTILKIGDRTLHAFSPESMDIRESEAKIVLGPYIDGFKRFCALGESGLSMMEHYENMAEELFGIKKGTEQGYVVLCAKKKKKTESIAAFKADQQANGVRLAKKLAQRLKGYAGIGRLCLHPASFGEVIPVGFVPEERDMVVIDSKGEARKILSVADQGVPRVPHATSSDPMVGQLNPVRAEEGALQ